MAKHTMTADGLKKLQNEYDYLVGTRRKEVAEKLAQCGIRGFWNFSNMELSLEEYNVKIENIHLGDTLMTLCYEISKLDDENNSEK